MFDVAATLAIISASGVTGWLGKAMIETLRMRSANRDTVHKATLDLEVHRDSLTFELLNAARTELKGLRQEVDRLRPLESHLFFFDQALGYIELLLCASGGDREQAERDAKLFLDRMRRRQRVESENQR